MKAQLWRCLLLFAAATASDEPGIVALLGIGDAHIEGDRCARARTLVRDDIVRAMKGRGRIGPAPPGRARAHPCRRSTWQASEPLKPEAAGRRGGRHPIGCRHRRHSRRPKFASQGASAASCHAFDCLDLPTPSQSTPRICPQSLAVPSLGGIGILRGTSACAIAIFRTPCVRKGQCSTAIHRCSSFSRTVANATNRSAA